MSGTSKTFNLQLTTIFFHYVEIVINENIDHIEKENDQNGEQPDDSLAKDNDGADSDNDGADSDDGRDSDDDDDDDNEYVGKLNIYNRIYISTTN